MSILPVISESCCAREPHSEPHRGADLMPRLTALDSVGATLSFACAIHCIALPFVVTALPLLGLSFLAGGPFELVMILLTLTLATTSFCWGVRVHGQRKTFLFIAAAAVFFFSGFFLVSHDHSEVDLHHWILMGIGGLALASGHYLNHRLCKSCRECCEN